MNRTTIPKCWRKALSEEICKDYFINLQHYIEDEYETNNIFPPKEKVYACFDYCKYQDVKVVIIGQDPYHGEGQANGLCFSVNDGIKQPPSLKNIFKERENDLGIPIPNTGNLESWAKQGVLMLNSILTVEKSKAGSHRRRGWETFTDTVVDLISKQKHNIVFMLWGAYAHKKGAQIDTNKHLVIKSAHPSPFSARNGFFGSKPFSTCNQYLKGKGLKEIDWE